MAGSMLSNQPLTLKTTITTVMGTGATFEIFETGIVLTKASIVFRNKLQLERLVVDIATDGVCTIVLRGLDQSQTKTEVPANKKERTSGAEGYITTLAFDIVDKDNTGDTQVLAGGYQFTGNVDITGTLSTATATLTNLTVNGKFKGPTVADVTARDALYPSPIDGNIVQVESLGIQYYKTSAGGWVTLDEGTPTPDATEVVKGKARIATIAEVTAGTDDATIVTPLKANSLKTPEALFEKDQYIAGETILANDSLFVESLPTFAESTVVQNIGDVTANTRVSILGIGSGVASNTLKLSLRKFVSPTADLSVRLETISGGLPTGTLIDPDATAIINSSNLTTSLADTTIVLGSRTTTGHGVTLNSNETTQFAYKGLKFNPNGNISIVTVEKISGSTATKAYIYDSNYTLLTSVSFVGDIATLNTDGLLDGEDYYVVAGSDGSSYTSVKQTGSTSFPYTNTKLNYTGGFNKSVDASDVSNNNTSGNGQAFNTGGFVTFSVTNSCKLASFNSTSHTITGNCELRDNSGTLIETAVGNNFSENTVLVKGTNYRIQYTKASGGPNLSTTLALTAGKNITYVSDSNGANKYLGNYTINTVGHYDESSDINNIVNITSVDDITAITKGQQVAIVLSQVGDVVNATNYYGVGYVARDTSTRPIKRYTGSNWSPTVIIGSTTADAHGLALSSASGGSNSQGVRLQASKNIRVKTVTKNASSAATRARILSDAGAVLDTATFIGNVATFSNTIQFSTSSFFRIECDNNGAFYSGRYNSTPGFPITKTNFIYNTGSELGVNNGNLRQIDSISTEEYETINNISSLAYISSTLFENRVLAKTSASYSYKLPTDYVRIATQGYSIGQSVTSKYFGLHNYPGLVANTAYYIANTPGQLSTTAGTNSYKVGKFTDTNQLYINPVTL